MAYKTLQYDFDKVQIKNALLSHGQVIGNKVFSRICKARKLANKEQAALASDVMADIRKQSLRG